MRDTPENAQIFYKKIRAVLLLIYLSAPHCKAHMPIAGGTSPSVYPAAGSIDYFVTRVIKFKKEHNNILI